MLLQCREQVEFERYTRVACRHHRMRDELPRLGAAVVAIEADIGAHLRILQRHQTGPDIRRVAGTFLVMDLQPAFGGAMAAFAAYPIAGMETRAAARLRHVGGVATQARGRRCCGPEPERLGNLAPATAGEHRIGAAVGAACRGRFLPACDFILPDDCPVAFRSAMAGRSRAGRDPFKPRTRCLRLSGRGFRAG